ncbi:LysR family transcriptional regulator [Rhodobacteraceae bacterium]|nr:LysR family transcriptional regulator [Paracoccaceae bacterium]
MNITFKQLTYLLSLDKHRNFSRAAAAVNVTQPALSMQIRELEQVLGTILIERRPRDIGFTRAGRMVLEHARTIQGELKSLGAELRRGQGQINLGVIPTVAPYLIPQALPRLQQIESGLRLREAQTDTLLDELRAGKIDAAVIATSVAGLEAIDLFEDRFLLAGAAAVMGRMQGLAPDAIDPGELLLLDEGHCLTDQALQVCTMTRDHARVDLGASSLSTLCALVGGGLGVTLLPELAVASECRGAPSMVVSRFTSEPSRVLRLVRRADGAEEGDWFAEIATIIREIGTQILNDIRVRYPCAAVN